MQCDAHYRKSLNRHSALRSRVWNCGWQRQVEEGNGELLQSVRRMSQSCTVRISRSLQHTTLELKDLMLKEQGADSQCVSEIHMG